MDQLLWIRCVPLFLFLVVSWAQELNKAALKFHQPHVFMWTSRSNYDPYVSISRRQISLSEYVIIHSAFGVFDFHIMYYDPKIKNVSEQSLGKEYYWKFLNSTGAIPGATLLNTTFSLYLPFTTRPNDVIAFHSKYHVNYKTDLQIPTVDLVMEYPANTGHMKSFLSIVDYSTFPLVRWRFSKAHWATWEEILEKCISLRPAYPHPANESESIYHDVSPQDLRMLENPCARDLFVFYLVVHKRQDHFGMYWGPQRQVFFSIPIALDLSEARDWVDMTEAFCLTFPDDCALVEEIILTNGHLLSVTNRGIFVSETMKSAPLTYLTYENLPLLSFHLIDPCSHIRDLFYCYTDEGVNALIHSVKLHYVPVCHIFQAPHFRDIVIMVISHDTLNEYKLLQNKLAWTVLWAEQPYVHWNLLIKSATKFDRDLIHNIKSAYYNYQINHFDFVAEVGIEKFPIKAYLAEERWHVRFILPMPKKDQKPGYYDVLSTALSEGFLPKVFPKDFRFRKLEVSTGSLDLLFIGNQIWIAESGGHFVYLSVPFLRSDVEYCNFNHPDRYFICVDLSHTRIYVGKVSAYYRVHEVLADDFAQLREVAIEEGWFIAPSSRFDSKLTRFIKPAYESLEGRVFEYLGRPVIQKAMKGVFFRVSYQGNIHIWYMDGGMKNEHAMVPKDINIKQYEDAVHIVSADGQQPGTDIPKIFKKAEDAIDSKIGTFRNLFHSRLIAKANKPARMALVSIHRSLSLPFEYQADRPPLVPFLIDGITVALYEARIPGNLGFSRTDVGNTVHCMRKLRGRSAIKSCELYIRHIKFVDDDWLPGFSAIAFAYILKSIPMHAFSCHTMVHVNPRSNDVFIYIKKDAKGSNSTLCTDWKRSYPFHYIGWTFYVPGHFSVLITLPEKFTLPDQYPPSDPSQYIDDIIFGKSTTTFDRRFEVHLSRYEAFFINMASIYYQDLKIPYHPEKPLSEEELHPSLPSWYSHPGSCLFEISLVPNPVLKSSGGVIQLNLHDSISFSATVRARIPQGEVMMQQLRFKVTNSNTKILSLRQHFARRITSQSIHVTVKPTGFGIGQSTVVVRGLTCLPNCPTPCSLTLIFQVMRAEGKKLEVHYPVKIPSEEILNPDKNGNVMRNGTVIYMTLPVNYRPPSIHGASIPTAKNIYNADPSKKPLYKTTYKISQASGDEAYKKCKGKASRVDCDCSMHDKLEYHPDFTDCRELVYRVPRAASFIMRITFPPVMEPAFQHQGFYLAKPHLLVWVEEVNGREDYSLTSNGSSYMDKINSDQQLHHGKRYYNAEGLEFALFGTGLYHFRAALGEFDTFDDVSGYFMVYSEEYGLDDLSFMLFFFATVLLCFLLTFCGFLRVKKRLSGHIPLREIVDDGKVTKVD